MKLNRTRQSGLWKVILGAAIVISLVVVRGTHAGNEPVHLATDWSHRHVIFSTPHNFMQQLKLSSNPRYVQQWVRRNSQKNGAQENGQNDARWRRAPEPIAKPLHRDWSTYLGYAGDPAFVTPATVGSGNYPAKFSFNPTSANCETPAPPVGQQPDFVVYNTSLQGSSSNVPFIDAATIQAQPAAGDTIDIFDNFGNGVHLILTAGITDSNTVAGSNGTIPVNGTGTFNATDTSLSNVAAHIAAAINLPGNASTFSGFGTTLSATNTPGSNVVNIAFTTASGFPSFAIYPGYVSASGTTTTDNSILWDFGRMVGGGAGIPTVVAIDNLYEGLCSSATPFYNGSTPTYYWAYNTGGQAVTSPALSNDGTQVAFVQNVSGAASLVILKWRANSQASTYPSNPPLGTVELPVTLTTQASGAAYRACNPLPDPGGCMITIPLSGGATDSKSSPFVDYSHDVIYVGDDNGMLHKITGVFLGNPAEVISAGANVWPASVDPTAQLNSVVFDDSDGGVNPGNPGIFTTDNQGVLWRIDATVGSGAGGKVRTAKLADTGFDDGPVLDPTTGNLYVFARGDERGGSGGGPAERSGVFQFPVRFAANAAGTEAVVSTDNTLQPTAFFTGDFDNNYYTSANGTGSMYVCNTNAGKAAMWQIPVTAGVLGTPVPGPTLTSVNADCSPVTEFENGTTDRIFVSVTTNSLTTAPISCPTNLATYGCVMSFDVTSSAGWNVSKPTAATEGESGGTSGIVVDNSSAAAGSSQIYFTPLFGWACNPGPFPGITAGLGGCSIQTSQNGLL
jgi:hypothetical protein